MNNQRRKQIKEAMLKIETITHLVQHILDDEQEAFENMPESLQCADNGAASEEAQECLESAIEALEQAIACLEEVC